MGSVHPAPALRRWGDRSGEGRADLHSAAFRLPDGEQVRHLYNPPSNVGIEDDEGVWFFARLAGGGSFTPVATIPAALSPSGVQLRLSPPMLAPVAERIGAVVLQYDMDRRIRGFAKGCSDPLVLAAVR